jgi:membrane associated rhomboid family serine protease
MGESDRYQDYRITRRRFTLGQPGNALFALFAINIAAFFLILLFNVFTLYAQQGQDNSTVSAMHWFAMSANLVTLSERPWTIITFMFAQGGNPPLAALFAMAGSMLWLWVFGYILQDLSGNRYLVPVYIYGSLSAAVFFLIASNTIPFLSQYKNDIILFSAQYGTTAIALAITTLSPGYRIFKNFGNGIPVWVLTGLYLLVNLIYAFNVSSATSFAVLGAALAGFGFIYFLRKGKDASAWMHNFYNWCGNLFTPAKAEQQNQTREKVFYNTGGRQPYNKKSNVTQQRIDEILDKINQRGYQFLTDEEKSILKRAGEEDI